MWTPANSQLARRRALRFLLSRIWAWVKSGCYFSEKKKIVPLLYIELFPITTFIRRYSDLKSEQDDNVVASSSTRAPSPSQPFPFPRTLLPRHLHIWTSKLYALPSKSYFFLLSRNLNFSSPIAEVSLYLFSLFTFTLPSPSGFYHLPLSYFLATLQFSPFSQFCSKSTKKKKRKKEKGNFLNVFHYIVNYERQLCTLVVHLGVTRSVAEMGTG